jgi:hypothetical protein
MAAESDWSESDIGFSSVAIVATAYANRKPNLFLIAPDIFSISPTDLTYSISIVEFGLNAKQLPV